MDNRHVGPGNAPLSAPEPKPVREVCRDEHNEELVMKFDRAPANLMVSHIIVYRYVYISWNGSGKTIKEK